MRSSFRRALGPIKSQEETRSCVPQFEQARIKSLYIHKTPASEKEDLQYETKHIDNCEKTQE